MFDVPIDAWYAWFGVAAASVALLGAVGSLPTAPPPDAAAAANTVDEVAAAGAPTVGEHPLAADAVRVGPHRLGLRTDADASHAAFAYGPVTPALDGKLRRVLRGEPPERLFDSRREFEQAVIESRARDPAWRPAPDRLRVRAVSWEGVDVTLVG